MMKEEYNDDRELRQLFDDFHPKITDGKDFMEQLERRMDAIEWVNRMQVKEKKRTRRAMFCAFGGGLAVGCVLYALLIPCSTPMQDTTEETLMPSPLLNTFCLLLRIVSENIQLLLYATISAITITAIVMTIDMWQKNISMKEVRRMEKAFFGTMARESLSAPKDMTQAT